RTTTPDLSRSRGPSLHRAAASPAHAPALSPGVDMPAGHRTRDDRGTLTKATEAIYWLVVIDVLLVLASLPTAMVWMLLAQDASNIPLYTASLLFVLPAVAAAFWAWRARAQDFDPVPLSRFLRGYRLNVLDSLKSGVPGVVVLAVLATKITYGGADGTRFLNVRVVAVPWLGVSVRARARSHLV